MAQCDSTEVAAHIRDTHVAVPFMARLDDATMAHAAHLKLIIQYGVGVEGVDIPAVCPCSPLPFPPWRHPRKTHYRQFQQPDAVSCP